MLELEKHLTREELLRFTLLYMLESLKKLAEM
jgi:hypothetical protein